MLVAVARPGDGWRLFEMAMRGRKEGIAASRDRIPAFPRRESGVRRDLLNLENWSEDVFEDINFRFRWSAG